MKTIHSLSRRAAALLLAVLLAVPTVYADAGARKLQTSIELVDGLTYQNTITENNSSRIESFSFELEPESAGRPILLQSSGTIYGAASISKAVSRAQELGYHVLGAINTDFFSMSNGMPLGIVIEDGVYKSSSGAENAMLITDGAVSIVQNPTIELSLYNEETGYTAIPQYFNKVRSDIGGVYLLNSDFSSVSTRTSSSGWYIRLRAAGSTEFVPAPEPETPTDPGTDPAADPNADLDTDPAADPNAAPDTDPNADPGTDPDTDPNGDPATDPSTGADPGEAPGTDPGTAPTRPALVAVNGNAEPVPLPALTVNSSIALEVVETLHSDQPLSIPQGEYILTAADLSGREDVFQAFQAGDKVTLNTICQSPAVSAAQWAGGVGDIMVWDGVVTDTAGWTYSKDGRQPRTALGLKEDGTLVLYAVDGRKSGYSSGLSQLDLAMELLNRGCLWVVNLDGGGSTSLSAWLPGQSGPVLKNTPSDGRARSCATFLLLVTDQRGNGQAERLAWPEDGPVVLAGSSLPLPQAAAMDGGLNPVSAALDNLTVRSQTGLGTVEDGIYTAGDRPGTDILHLSDPYSQAEGFAQIHVVDSLTSFTVSKAGSTSPLSSIQVEPGEQIQLTASGQYWSRAALRDFGPVTWTAEGNPGTVDSSGLFTASEHWGGGSITFSAGGLSQTVQFTMENVHQDVPEDHWAYEAVDYCYRNGIVTGVAPTRFGLDNHIRRGDFMLMLYSALGRPAVEWEATFTDVSPSDYYYTALSWGQVSGLASGTGQGAFSPLNSITREQAFTILRQALPLLEKTVPDGDLAILDQFSDRDMIANYAQGHTATLVEQGLVSGKGDRVDPQGLLTRAEMAAILYKLITFTPAEPETPEQPDIPGINPENPERPDIPGTNPENPERPDIPGIKPETPEQPDIPGTKPENPEQPDIPGIKPENPEQPDIPDIKPENPEQPAQYTLTLDRTQLSLASGGSDTLTAALVPAPAQAPITWTSSDPKLAHVSASGMVTNLNPGKTSAEVTITASWNGLNAACTVTCDPARRSGTVTNAELGLNVRSGPGTDYNVTGSLANGDQVLVMKEEEGWYQILHINAKGQAAIGYVSMDYLTAEN